MQDGRWIRRLDLYDLHEHAARLARKDVQHVQLECLSFIMFTTTYTINHYAFPVYNSWFIDSRCVSSYLVRIKFRR